MTARRIGWTWNGQAGSQWHTFVDRAGRKIDMREVCPKDVRAMAMLGSSAAMWAKWTSSAQWQPLAPRPCLEPLVRLCNGRASASSVGRTVAHLVTKGPVTQSVLRQWGKTEDDLCQACLAGQKAAIASISDSATLPAPGIEPSAQSEDQSQGVFGDEPWNCTLPSQLTQRLDERFINDSSPASTPIAASATEVPSSAAVASESGYCTAPSRLAQHLDDRLGATCEPVMSFDDDWHSA